VLVDRLLHLGGQGLLQSARLRGEGRHVGAAAGQHQARKTRRLLEGLLHRKHAAPGMAEQVHSIEAERVTHCTDFVDKCVHHPQGGVIGIVGFPAAELVIETTGRPVSARIARSCK
jgi:hypothetical protein